MQEVGQSSNSQLALMATTLMPFSAVSYWAISSGHLVLALVAGISGLLFFQRLANGLANVFRQRS